MPIHAATSLLLLDTGYTNNGCRNVPVAISLKTKNMIWIYMWRGINWPLSLRAMVSRQFHGGYEIHLQEHPLL
jgi:hypothetical protein